MTTPPTPGPKRRSAKDRQLALFQAEPAPNPATARAASEPRVTDPLSKRRLKMWIRLLGVTRTAESHLREFLRLGHETTLPRFDVMAALWRRREGVTMSELSRLLLVSNGNATTIVDRLEKDGLVRRSPLPSDRRTIFVALTEEGIANFDKIAADHEAEINRLFEQLDEADLDALTAILKRVGRDMA